MALSKFDQARQALAEAKTLAEISGISDDAIAMRELGRRIDSRQLEIDAAELRQRAERRLGQMLIEVKNSTGFNAGSRGQLRGRLRPGDTVEASPIDTRPRLADLGLDAKESARCQAAAAVPDRVFERAATDWRERVSRGALRVNASIVALANRSEAKKASRTEQPRPASAARSPYRTIVVSPFWSGIGSPRMAPTGNRPPVQPMDAAGVRRLCIGALAAKEAHVFLWTPARTVRDAEDILPVWGFQAQFVMVWHKTEGPQPFGWPEFNAEFVVCGRRGRAGFRETKDFACCFSGKARPNGRKPDEFYDLIARVTPEPRVEVLGREARQGFDLWSNGDPAPVQLVEGGLRWQER